MYPLLTYLPACPILTLSSSNKTDSSQNRQGAALHPNLHPDQASAAKQPAKNMQSCVVFASLPSQSHTWLWLCFAAYLPPAARPVVCAELLTAFLDVYGVCSTRNGLQVGSGRAEEQTRKIGRRKDEMAQPRPVSSPVTNETIDYIWYTRCGS